MPRTSIAPEDPADPRSRPRSPRSRLIAATAGACAIGLGIVGALPLIGIAEAETLADEPVAAATPQQRLFSETDAAPEDLPELLGDAEITADESVPASFEYRADALVSFPIPDNVTLTDGFGYRTAPVAQFHDAQDFAAAAGTKIYAIADGTVREAGFASDGCGFALKLEHEIDGQQVTSRYCHMETDSHSYAEGDTVKMGDQVGRVGNTGMSFGPHLHLAIRLDDKPIDPMPFLSKYSRMDRAKSENPGSATHAKNAE